MKPAMQYRPSLAALTFALSAMALSLMALVAGCRRVPATTPDAGNKVVATPTGSSTKPSAPEPVDPGSNSSDVEVGHIVIATPKEAGFIPGSGATPAEISPPRTGGIGPNGPLFGDGGNARRIVFLCDASGSMITKMPTLKDQLVKTVRALRPIQSFEIIFFRDSKFDSFIKFAHQDSLVAATPEAKRSAERFLGNAIPATTDPIPAIIAAFKTKPELVYLLTDGDFPDNDVVLKTIRDLNSALPANKKVKFNTIAFVSGDDNEVTFLNLLKTIAKETGGKFRQVKEPDL